MRRTAVFAASAVLLFAGCGGNDETPTATPAATGTATEAPTQAPSSGSTLKIEADPSGALKFTQTALTATAGKVEIDFSNPSEVPHAVQIEGVKGSESETVTAANAKPITVNLKPGQYTFYCPVDAHRAAGMEGKLTVR